MRAAGCRLWTADGLELIDCTMALGAVALGYAEAAVTMAVTQAAAQGNVAGLSHVLEVELAERLSRCDPVRRARAVSEDRRGRRRCRGSHRARAHAARDT